MSEKQGAGWTDADLMYYGLNAMSYNLIMVDRKLLPNPSGLILGTPPAPYAFPGITDGGNEGAGDPIL